MFNPFKNLPASQEVHTPPTVRRYEGTPSSRRKMSLILPIRCSMPEWHSITVNFSLRPAWTAIIRTGNRATPG